MKTNYKNLEKAHRILNESSAKNIRSEKLSNGDLLEWWQLSSGRVGILQAYASGEGLDLFTDHTGVTWEGFEMEVNSRHVTV